MSLVESKDGIQHFTFEHNRDYQQVQFKFFDAVESMDPNNIVVILFYAISCGLIWFNAHMSDRCYIMYVMLLFSLFFPFRFSSNSTHIILIHSCSCQMYAAYKKIKRQPEISSVRKFTDVLNMSRVVAIDYFSNWVFYKLFHRLIKESDKELW